MKYLDLSPFIVLSDDHRAQVNQENQYLHYRLLLSFQKPFLYLGD